MGRGRKGVLDQSHKKANRKNLVGDIAVYVGLYNFWAIM